MSEPWSHSYDERAALRPPGGAQRRSSAELRKVLRWTAVAGALNICALILEPCGTGSLKSTTRLATEERTAGAPAEDRYASTIAAATRTQLHAAGRPDVAQAESAVTARARDAVSAGQTTTSSTPREAADSLARTSGSQRAAKGSSDPVAKAGSRPSEQGARSVNASLPRTAPLTGAASHQSLGHSQQAPSHAAQGSQAASSDRGPATGSTLGVSAAVDSCRACEQTDVDCAPRLTAMESNLEKLPLSQALMACVRATRCAGLSGGYALIDCYCGNTDFEACIAGRAPGNGECRAQVEAAAESSDPVTVADRITRAEFATGLVNEVLGCDDAKCSTFCSF